MVDLCQQDIYFAEEDIENMNLIHQTESERKQLVCAISIAIGGFRDIAKICADYCVSLSMRFEQLVLNECWKGEGKHTAEIDYLFWGLESLKHFNVVTDFWKGLEWYHATKSQYVAFSDSLRDSFWELSVLSSGITCYRLKCYYPFDRTVCTCGDPVTPPEPKRMMLRIKSSASSLFKNRFTALLEQYSKFPMF